MALAKQKTTTMMMTNNLINTRACIAKYTVIALLSLLVCACGGGIAGTGDGTPILPIENNIENSSTGNPQSPTADSTGGETQAPTHSTNDQAPVPDLSMLIPSSWVAAQARNDQTSNSIAFTQQLTTSATEIEQISTALLNYESPNNNADPEGIYDNALSFSLESQDNTIKWSGNTLSLFSTNTNRHLYLSQNNQMITIRRLDRARNILFQANIINANGSLFIEAILNNNGAESYLRSTTDDNGSTVNFTQHPTDTSLMRQREIIDLSGTTTDVQTCIADTANNGCQIDDDWLTVNSNDADNANTLFASASANISSALQATAARDFQLPPDVVAAVLTDSSAEQPIAEEIQCGLILVNGTVREFCLQPLPVEITGNRFQELLSGGQVFYQLMP